MEIYGTYFFGQYEIHYDFREDFEFQPDFLGKKEDFRPRKPISFQLSWNGAEDSKVGEEKKETVKTEVWYKQGLYPQIQCSCSQKNTCRHISFLQNQVFPAMLERIYKKYGSSYNRDYLRDEVAMKIRMISPLSERKILEDFLQKQQQKQQD